MPYGVAPVIVRYADAQHLVLDADVLFYRGTSWFVAPFIRALSQSEYSHAGMAGWTNGDSAYRDLMVYDMRWNGGQCQTLESHVQENGSLDMYRCADTHTAYRWDPALKLVCGNTAFLDRKAAVQKMRSFCKPGAYGRMNLWLTALTRLPLLRMFFHQPTNDQLAVRKRPPYCSEAVAYALHSAFTDVVRNTPDQYTTPGALACSPLLHYMFTIVP